MRRDRSTISTALETTLVRRRKRARKWRMLLVVCSAANVAVVLLDGEGQVFAGEELVFGDETVKAFPVVGEEGLALEADFIEELLTEPAPAKALGDAHISQLPSRSEGTKVF